MLRHENMKCNVDMRHEIIKHLWSHSILGKEIYSVWVYVNKNT